MAQKVPITIARKLKLPAAVNEPIKPTKINVKTRVKPVTTPSKAVAFLVPATALIVGVIKKKIIGMMTRKASKPPRGVCKN